MKGTVTDQTGIVQGVPNVNLVLQLNPKDHLAPTLTTKTDT